MDYMPRPGIVKTKVCGVELLVPTRKAAAYCKTTLPLGIKGIIIWTGIEKDYAIEEVLKAYRIFVKEPDEALLQKIEEYCQSLYEKGFAIPKDPNLLATDDGNRDNPS